MNFKNENINNENMNNEVELNNNKGDLKMNYNIKLISEISTAQSKRFYNNKQTLRPTINKNGQLNVIKTEVNKEELSYNEVTLNKSTINQLKHGIYDSFGRNKFIPSLTNLNNLDEIYLREDDIEKIPALKWIYYPASALNKNNPYICMLSNCLGAEAIIIIMVQEDFRSIKVVTDNIDLILWLDDIKYNYTINENNLRSQTVRELNNYREMMHLEANYEESLYEKQGTDGLKITEASDYDNWKYEVVDTPENIVKNKRNINKSEILTDKLQRTKNKLNNINSKDYNLDEYLELFFNDKLVNQVSNYINRGQDLYNHLSNKVNDEGYIIGTNQKETNKKRIDKEHGIGFKAVWVVYYELQKEELLLQIETLTNELNKLNIDA